MFREEILKEDCTVECESEKQIKNLFKWLDSKGYKWIDSTKLLAYIPKFKEKVYIIIRISKLVGYSDEYYDFEDLYDYNEIIKKPEPKDTTIGFMLDYLPDVKKIIHSDPDTVLIFNDGSTSTVERQQKHDLEKAILYAWVKKHKKGDQWTSSMDLSTTGMEVVFDAETLCGCIDMVKKYTKQNYKGCSFPFHDITRETSKWTS